MDNYRGAGQCLLVGIVLPLLILGLHPTAHDLTAESGSRMATINHLVHGIAIAAQPLVLLGPLGLTQYLGWSLTAAGAFVVYCHNLVGTLFAALMSGFVASDIVVKLRGAEPSAQAGYQSLLDYTHVLNQAFARFSVLAAGIALVLWSVAILRSGKLSRLTAIVGCAVGAILGLGILLGQLPLNVGGILLATALQAVWLAMVALQLQRLPGRTAGAL